MSLITVIVVAMPHRSDMWTVYFHKDLHENEQCSQMRCRQTDACLVKDQQAMCVRLDKLDQIEGIKLHHSTNEQVDTQKVSERADWDPDRLAVKMQRYQHQKTLKSQHTKEHPHKKRHMDKPEDGCSDEDLAAVGGRLMKWFSDVHSRDTKEPSVRPVKPIAKHQVACRADVAWMFVQWDGDDDGELTMDELRSLEGDEYEHCVKPFLDRCDDNADDTLSIDEWCDCFAFSRNERQEPMCHAAAHKVDPHMLGAFRPRCDVDGWYRPMQCHEGECWCVDQWGREFPSSRVRFARADCGQYADGTEEDVEEKSLSAEL